MDTYRQYLIGLIDSSLVRPYSRSLQYSNIDFLDELRDFILNSNDTTLDKEIVQVTSSPTMAETHPSVIDESGRVDMQALQAINGHQYDVNKLLREHAKEQALAYRAAMKAPETTVDYQPKKSKAKKVKATPEETPEE